MDTEFVVALISVCGLIVVAILNGLVPACLDSKRAKRERTAAERERIRKAAAQLLRNLANFRHPGQDDQKLAAGSPSHQQVTADMRGAYDAWALVVMPRLDASRQGRVKEIREKELGRDNLKNTEAKVSSEIFELTWIASRNVQ
jgi:hypothetical protein